MAKAGEPSRHQRAAGRADMGRQPAARALAHAARARRGGGMANDYGSGTVVIRRSHHIACLAAYLKRVTDRGLVAIVHVLGSRDVVRRAFGGVSPVFTPNPMAAGIPTSGDPILLDISASYTTNGMTGRLHKERPETAAPVDPGRAGQRHRRSRRAFTDPKGTLLPLGGLDAGHKGYALRCSSRRLTGGLAGHGRADASEGWGATVFVQVLDPAAFGGVDDFHRRSTGSSMRAATRRRDPAASACACPAKGA